MADEPDQGALSLEEVEQDFWGDAPADASRLIRTAHELRRKPLNTFTAEDLRLLISQEIGVEALVPQAIALLRQDPLAEGDFYPGDLLVAVMKLPSAYWDAHRDELNAMHKIVRSVANPDSQLQDDIDRFLSRTVHLT
jgi:CDI immunity proteins